MILKAIAGAGCDHAGCGRSWDIRLQEGATLLNPGKSVKLCDDHWTSWLAEESELRKTLDSGAHPQNAHHKRHR